jgi:hypothetical protein
MMGVIKMDAERIIERVFNGDIELIEETLTDGSKVYNVRVKVDEGRVTIGGIHLTQANQIFDLMREVAFVQVD